MIYPYLRRPYRRWRWRMFSMFEMCWITIKVYQFGRVCLKKNTGGSNQWRAESKSSNKSFPTKMHKHVRYCWCRSSPAAPKVYTIVPINKCRVSTLRNGIHRKDARIATLLAPHLLLWEDASDECFLKLWWYSWYLSYLHFQMVRARGHFPQNPPCVL